jgi:hypothetical protein
VTSSHAVATPLRYGVTGHLAGNQSVRSRQAIVSLMNRPTASTSRSDLQKSVAEKQAHSFRALIVVSACGAFVAALRKRL